MGIWRASVADYFCTMIYSTLLKQKAYELETLAIIELRKFNTTKIIKDKSVEAYYLIDTKTKVSIMHA